MSADLCNKNLLKEIYNFKEGDGGNGSRRNE